MVVFGSQNFYNNVEVLFHGGIMEDLMQNRFHPTNMDKLKGWGFDGPDEDDDWMRILWRMGETVNTRKRNKNKHYDQLLYFFIK